MPLIAQIAPGRRPAPRLASRRPSLRDGLVGFGLPGLSFPFGLARHQSHKRRNPHEGLHEIAAVQMLDQRIDIALCIRQWVEPSLAVVNDDDDIVASAVFDRFAGAFLEVDREAAGFQHRRTADPAAQLFYIRLFHSSLPAACGRPFSKSISSIQFAEHSATAAKSKGRKGAASAAAQSPLRPAARKRHAVA